MISRYPPVVSPYSECSLSTPTTMSHKGRKLFLFWTLIHCTNCTINININDIESKRPYFLPFHFRCAAAAAAAAAVACLCVSVSVFIFFLILIHLVNDIYYKYNNKCPMKCLQSIRFLLCFWGFLFLLYSVHSKKKFHFIVCGLYFKRVQAKYTSHIRYWYIHCFVTLYC